MKKSQLLFLLFTVLSFAAKAQDVITLTNGTTVQAKVLEITPTEVKYKDFNNQDGPIITILKSTVSSIKYANGTQTLFNESSPSGDKPAGGHFERGSGNGNYRDRGRGAGDPYVSYRKKSEKNSRPKGWYFGFDFNYGFSSAGNKDPNYSTSGDACSGLHFLATKMFNPHVGLQFGLGEDIYNYNVNFSATGIYGPGSDLFGLYYLTVPVRVAYFSNSKERVGFYGIAGLDLSLLALARDNEQDDLSAYYKTALFNPYLSAGVEFRTKYARTLWMFGLFYKTSAGNFYSGKSDVTGTLNTGNTGSINSFGITVNCMTKFGRGGRR